MSKYISTWLVLGPIPSEVEINAASIIKSIGADYPIYPVTLTKSLENAPQENDIFLSNKWKTLNFGGKWDIDYISDNIRTLPGFSGLEHVLAFFLVYIWSPECRATGLYVRADDSIRVWLNGTELNNLKYEGERGITEEYAGETYSDIVLKGGCNILMIAVANTIGRWGFSARIDNDEGLKLTTEKSACIELKYPEVYIVQITANCDQSTENGDLSVAKPINWAGYRLVISFTEIVGTKFKPVEISVNVGETGCVPFSLPELERIYSDAYLRLIAPDGKELYSNTLRAALAPTNSFVAALSKNIRICVDLQKCLLTPVSTKNPAFGKPSKIRGRVIDAKGCKQAANKQVILSAIKSKDEPLTPLAVARTDSSGYFSTTYPIDSFIEAYGIVSVKDNKPISIPLDKNCNFPENVILVVEMDAEDAKCDIDFVPRVPDSLDLTTAEGSFSTDVGAGRCVDFTKPNRTLEEFSFYYAVRTTDPEVKKFSFETKLTRERVSLNFDNSIDWDSESLVRDTYQAGTIAHGHLLHLKQEWVADGYSLGDLLYSLPLAPCQKKQIVIMDWERRESAFRSESLLGTDYLSAAYSRDRDINEIAAGVFSENIRGGSSASTHADAYGGGIGAMFKSVGLLVGYAGSSSSASSDAWQDSSREMSANSLQQLRDRTSQSASSVRSQRSTVIQTAQQGERMRVESEVVANNNHCHAITIEYFEVLRHFLVRQRLADVQECLFIPLVMSKFDDDKALRWREALSSYLRNPELSKGFDALERIKNRYEGSDFPLQSYADEPLEYIQGGLYITFDIAFPRDPSEDEIKNLRGYLNENWKWLPQYLRLSLEAVYKNALKAKEERDRNIRDMVGEGLAAFVKKLQFFAVGQNDLPIEIKMDTTLISKFHNGGSHFISLAVIDVSNLNSITRRQIKNIKISCNSELIPAKSRIIVESGYLSYRTEHFESSLFSNSWIQNDLASGDDVLISTPLSREEKRNPRQEDIEISKRLITHLNEHIEYYHHAIWFRMEPSRRFMLLDGFIAPNSNGRSVASVIENRLIGFVGNCLVMPVARGFHLDPTFALNSEDSDSKDSVTLLEHYQPTTPIDPMRITIPTKGVFAESVMGSCNSCEHKEEERFWRWEESPCPDSPTSISPVGTESRRAEVPDMTAKDFAAPIINLQNAPTAPDPTGLGAALQLLGKSDAFKDITGLTENQRNALAALQRTMQSAEFFGGQAANLALQARMSQDIDKTLTKIQESRDKNLISAEQANRLTEKALSAMSGGGALESVSSPQKEKITNSPEVKKFIESASETGNSSFEFTSTEGEKVSVRRGLLASADPYFVPNQEKPPSENFLLEMAGTVLAESYDNEEQKTAIAWVYFNRFDKYRENGLEYSVAYKKKSPWFKIWMTALEQPTYANEKPTTKIKDVDKFGTIAEYIAQNRWVKDKASKVLKLVKSMFSNKPPVNNPYPGWLDQCNITDFNKDTSFDNKIYRWYFHLQEQNDQLEKLVKILPGDSNGNNKSIIFNREKIDQYFKENPKEKDNAEDKTKNVDLK